MSRRAINNELGRRAGNGFGYLAAIVLLMTGSPAFVGANDSVAAPVGSVSVEDVLVGKYTTAFQPEYDRALDRVMLSVHNIVEKVWVETNFRTLSRLPSYSSVVLLVAHNSTAETFARSQAVIDERVGTDSRVVRSGIAERWIQDIGEGGVGGFMLGAKGQAVLPDLMDLGIRAFRHFLPLDGGNVQLARNRAGRRFVVLGSEEFSRAADTILGMSGEISSASLAREAYLKTFGGDEVLVLPNLPGAHIDQTVLFLGDGLAVTEELPWLEESERRLFVNFQMEWVNAKIDGEKVRVPLYAPDYKGETRLIKSGIRNETYREVIPDLSMTSEQQEIFLRYRLECPHLHDLLYADKIRRNRLATERLLVEKGFEIIRLKNTVWHDYNCQNFVNAMPFRNRETGRPGVLLPVYRYAGAPNEFVDFDNLRGVNRENVEILQARGFDVIAVPSHLGLGGNLHCSILQF